MPDLTDWLAEQHAADERVAHEADFYRPGGHWEQHDFGNGYAVGTHIARHDPQSVLARIEGERAIVALHRPRMWQNFNGEDQELDPPHACEVCWDGFDEELHPCPTLRALAWGYRGRDGFDPSWAPEGVEVEA